ncbi:hypothetical protein C9374_012564 [Naegleria lovaniensis]|uniref:Conserved Oligomeric Golgi complex subunit 6 C-terminal domain-containing protein n=1 Tax=Naegleria lovaniensis TaxID=51637 RepID=A0AA88H380_NAELO|nr:uncharacterized protein C9374_012564 [Naegleria lovaniensis]KAG2392312.1 hypothetical protein C9374_012564 [Naegleria lovaniensis]
MSSNNQTSFNPSLSKMDLTPPLTPSNVKGRIDTSSPSTPSQPYSISSSTSTSKKVNQFIQLSHQQHDDESLSTCLQYLDQLFKQHNESATTQPFSSIVSSFSSMNQHSQTQLKSYLLLQNLHSHKKYILESFEQIQNQLNEIDSQIQVIQTHTKNIENYLSNGPTLIMLDSMMNDRTFISTSTNTTTPTTMTTTINTTLTNTTTPPTMTPTITTPMTTPTTMTTTINMTHTTHTNTTPCSSTCQISDYTKQMNSFYHEYISNLYRQYQLNVFISKFIFPEEEKQLLLHGKIRGQEYFTTLKKLDDMHSTCSNHFVKSSNYQRIIFEIMEELQMIRTSALERITRWIEDECKALSNDSEIDSEYELKQAINILFDKTIFLPLCLKQLIVSRSEFVKNQFFSALTMKKMSSSSSIGITSTGTGTGITKGQLSSRISSTTGTTTTTGTTGTVTTGTIGSSNNTYSPVTISLSSNPIEMLAHDPLRYIADILAWIHKSAVMEKELIQNLLSVYDHTSHNGQTTTSSSDSSVNTIPSHHTSNYATIANNNNTTATTSTTTTLNTSTPLNTLSNPTSYQVYPREPLLFKILNDIFDDLKGQLQMRVEQIINKNPTDSLIHTSSLKQDIDEEYTIVYFKLAHLLELYSCLFVKVMGDHCKLSVCLNDLKEKCMDKFFINIKRDLNRLIQKPPEITLNLNPPEEVKEVLNNLTEIMNTYSESVMVPENRREEDFQNVISAFIDPLLELYNNYYVNVKLKETDPILKSDYYVFIINGYYAILQALGGVESTSLSKIGTTNVDVSTTSVTRSKTELISTEMEKQLEIFTHYQSKLILENSGLQHKLNILHSDEHSKPFIPLSKCQDMDEQSLKAFFQNFYTQLFSLGSLALTQKQSCERLLSPRLKTYTKGRIALDVCNGYKQLYHAIMDEKNLYENPKEIVYHDPEQVKVLLDF